MKITFIKPNIGRKNGKRYIDTARMEPLPLARLAAMTPADVEVELCDDRAETVPFDAPTDLVAVTVDTYAARRTYEICNEYRARGVPVVLGGYHVTLAPEEAIDYADAVCVGEAEGIWPEIVDDARHGRLKGMYRAGERASLAGLTYRRDLFRGKGYLRLALVEFGRGCTNECSFCATGVFYQRMHTHRPVDEVVAEVKTLRHRLIFFVDDNIVSDVAAAKELFRQLISLRIAWVGQASMNFTQDEELADLLVRSGCVGLVIGFESIVPENLAQMSMNSNMWQDSWARTTEVVREKGLMIWGAFLLGCDHDDPATIDRTWRQAVKQRFGFAAFNTLTPYPGTAIDREFRAEGRLLYDKWWLDPRYRFGHATVTHPRMTPDELTAAAKNARRRFTSSDSILRRWFDRKTNFRTVFNALGYIWYNHVFRREILKKQDMLFGYNEDPPVPRAR
ncbi:MAG: B12-binding domain-containing radical SAM protein [Planctomycetota bacterium]|jgi:radical SAM superfamily enzyme YgiQ (UPF0313 family)